MSNYYYLKDAFWENNDKTKLKCIRMTKLSDGREKKDVLSLDKLLPNGSPNPTFNEAVEQITIAAIEKFTKERIQRKKGESGGNGGETQKIKKDQNVKKREYEDLFNQKLQAFEIEEIKNCEDKNLRARLRRAQSPMELNAVASLIIGKEMGLFDNGN